MLETLLRRAGQAQFVAVDSIGGARRRGEHVPMRELGGRSKSGAWERENQSAEKCWRPQSPRVLPLFLQLIQLVVQRLETDAELGGGGGLVAGVLFQHAEHVLHLDL